MDDRGSGQYPRARIRQRKPSPTSDEIVYEHHRSCGLGHPAQQRDRIRIIEMVEKQRAHDDIIPCRKLLGECVALEKSNWSTERARSPRRVRDRSWTAVASVNGECQPVLLGYAPHRRCNISGATRDVEDAQRLGPAPHQQPDRMPERLGAQTPSIDAF